MQLMGPMCTSATLSEDQGHRLLAMVLDGLAGLLSLLYHDAQAPSFTCAVGVTASGPDTQGLTLGDGGAARSGHAWLGRFRVP